MNHIKELIFELLTLGNPLPVFEIKFKKYDESLLRGIVDFIGEYYCFFYNYFIFDDAGNVSVILKFDIETFNKFKECQDLVLAKYFNDNKEKLEDVKLISYHRDPNFRAMSLTSNETLEELASRFSKKNISKVDVYLRDALVDPQDNYFNHLEKFYEGKNWIDREKFKEIIQDEMHELGSIWLGYKHDYEPRIIKEIFMSYQDDLFLTFLDEITYPKKLEYEHPPMVIDPTKNFNDWVDEISIEKKDIKVTIVKRLIAFLEEVNTDDEAEVFQANLFFLDVLGICTINWNPSSMNSETQYLLIHFIITKRIGTITLKFNKDVLKCLLNGNKNALEEYESNYFSIVNDELQKFLNWHIDFHDPEGNSFFVL